MHPFLIKRYAEKTALWTALGALNAPLAFLPTAISAYKLRRQAQQTPEESLGPAIRYGGFKRLESTSALALMANEMGNKIGVTFTHVYKSRDFNFENVMILQDKPKQAALLFQGDPLLDMDLVASGQQHQFLRGILAHELGHTHTRGTNHFQLNASITGGLYHIGAGLAMCVGWGSMLFGNFATGLGFLGTALAGAVAGTTALVLRSRNARNDEFLADIHGAKMFGADDLIITHDFAEKILSPQMEEEKNRYSGPDKPGLLARLHEKFIASTHPPSHERLAALRAIFKSTATFNLATCNLEGGPRVQRYTQHQGPAPERLQATRVEPKKDRHDPS